MTSVVDYDISAAKVRGCLQASGAILRARTGDGRNIWRQRADLPREARLRALEPGPLLAWLCAPRAEHKFTARCSINQSAAFIFKLRLD